MWRNRRLPGRRLLIYFGGLVGLARTVQESVDETGASVEEIDPTTRFEPKDVNAKAVFLAGVGTLLILWTTVVVLYPLFSYFKYARTGGQTPSKIVERLPPPPPAPRDQDHPHLVLKNYVQSEKAASRVTGG